MTLNLKYTNEQQTNNQKQATKNKEPDQWSCKVIRRAHSVDLQTGGQFPMCQKRLSYTPSSVWGFCPEGKKTHRFRKLFPNSAALKNLQRSCDAQVFSTLTESSLTPPGALSPTLPFPRDLPSHIVSSCDFTDFIFDKLWGWEGYQLLF